MYRIRSVNLVFMRLFRTKNLVLSGAPFFIVIDHKVNPVCDRINRIRFESDIPLQVGCCVTALFQFLLLEIRPILICFDSVTPQ